MKIVFATTVKGRTPHLARTLPQNLAHNLDAKFVVLSYNDQDGLATYVKENHAKDIESGRLSFYEYREPVPFQMSKAKNLAHRLGILEGADVLVNVDADNFCGEGFDLYVAAQFETPGIFLWSEMVKQGEGRLPRGISGRIAVTKDAFLLVGGYDEIYETHSPDDRDFNARLRRMGLEARKIDPRYLSAILHTEKMRFREYPHAMGVYSEETTAIQQKYSIANSGNVGCGVVFKNFSAEPITIAPITGRIFGIGMHKTATTSLHTAMGILGYKSGHWENAHWAKAIWREMNQTGKSKTLEQYHTLCDLPIPLLFRKLDASYPGSKFILTLRNEWKWLSSVHKHWGPGNKFRAQWDNDPFSHIVHRALYGRIDFDPATFLRRYRAHNAEVLEYFKNRPQDLLVMDMDNGAGWTELCKFLGRKIPSESYPSVAPGVR